MHEKSLPERAKQALAGYQKKGKYLRQRTRQQLQLIRRAAVQQIAEEVPQAKQYKGLQDNVDYQIKFRKQKRAEKTHCLTDNFGQGSPNMDEKSLQIIAKQALADYPKEENYLTLRTRQQLQLIRRAAVQQIAEEVPQAKQYKGLQDNVDYQIKFRKQSSISFRQKRAVKTHWLTDIFRSEKQHRKQPKSKSSGRNLFQWLREAYQHIARDKTVVDHGGNMQVKQPLLSQSSQQSSSLTANAPKSLKTKEQQGQERKAYVNG